MSSGDFREVDTMRRMCGQPSAPATCSPTALDGYRAAGKLMLMMLVDAEKRRPKRASRISRNSAAFRLGIYEAILTAHCWMVMGEYPENNADLIAEALSANAGTERAGRPSASASPTDMARPDSLQ